MPIIIGLSLIRKYSSLLIIAMEKLKSSQPHSTISPSPNVSRISQRAKLKFTLQLQEQTLQSGAENKSTSVSHCHQTIIRQMPFPFHPLKSSFAATIRKTSIFFCLQKANLFYAPRTMHPPCIFPSIPFQTTLLASISKSMPPLPLTIVPLHSLSNPKNVVTVLWVSEVTFACNVLRKMNKLSTTV